mgnify:CR=1 FL=1
MSTSRASSSLTTRSADIKEFFVLNDASEGRFLKLIRKRTLKYASLKYNRVVLMFEDLNVNIIFPQPELRGRVSVIRKDQRFAVDPILIIGGGRFLLDLLGGHDGSYNEVSIDVYNCKHPIRVEARSVNVP